MRALEGGFGKQDAVIGDNPDRVSVQMGKAGHQCLAIQRLELIELRAIDDARDHLAYIIGFADIGIHHAIEFFGRIKRITHGPGFQPHLLGPVQVRHDLPHDGQRVGVVHGKVIGHAAGPRVHIRTTKVLG